MIAPRGEVYDIGYQPYRGSREGRWHARKALWTNGVRTALGVGRGWSSKVLPGLLFVAAIIPAVVISITASVVGAGADVAGHADYYVYVSVVVMLFSAIIAPELLCADRRNRVIDLYLVRPLTSTDYVVGRWLAFFSVTLALLYLGQVVLLIGLTLGAEEPFEHLRENWLDIPRFLLAGVVVALFTTTIPMAVSAFTTRRAVAAAFVIGLFIISVPVGWALTGCDEGDAQRGERSVAAPESCEPRTGDAARWLVLVALPETPWHVNNLYFPQRDVTEFGALVGKQPSVVPVFWYLLLTAGPGLVLWWRYRRLKA